MLSHPEVLGLRTATEEFRGDTGHLITIMRHKIMAFLLNLESIVEFLSPGTCRSLSKLNFSHVLVPLAAGALSVSAWAASWGEEPSGGGCTLVGELEVGKGEGHSRASARPEEAQARSLTVWWFGAAGGSKQSYCIPNALSLALLLFN